MGNGHIGPPPEQNHRQTPVKILPSHPWRVIIIYEQDIFRRRH